MTSKIYKIVEHSGQSIPMSNFLPYRNYPIDARRRYVFGELLAIKDKELIFFVNEDNFFVKGNSMTT